MDASTLDRRAPPRDVAAIAPGTGHGGHRGRMREKLLGAGPDALADYELLEMLLFLGIPRRDTKPLAKLVIQRFRGLAPAIAAPPEQLRRQGELNEDSIRVLKLVAAAATALARAERRDRPRLDNWERLSAYLDASLAGSTQAQCRVLFLNNRNQLLADEAAVAPEGGPEAANSGADHASGAFARDILKRALALHATALILVLARPAAPPRATAADARLALHLKRAVGVLDIVLHDAMVVGRGGWISLRQAGRL